MKILIMNYRMVSLQILVVFCFGCSATRTANLERTMPTDFIEITSKPWNQETTIEVEIANKSKLTDYSNIVILVTYYDAKSVSLGTERIVYYQIIKSKQKAKLIETIHLPLLPVATISLSLERVVVVDYNEKGLN